MDAAPDIIAQHPTNGNSSISELRAERQLLTQLVAATGDDGELARLRDEVEDKLIEALRLRRRRTEAQ